MAVMKLYGVSKSTCTLRVATILKEKKVPYELISVNMMEKENHTPEYRQKQPFGQVPVLDDNGFLVYESRAIGRYIALKYANQGTQDLIPNYSDIQAIGRFEEACSLEYSQFNPSAEGLAAELVFKKRYTGQDGDPVVVAKHNATLAKKLDVYDQILSERKYLTGDHVTIADLFHLSYGDILTNTIKSDAITSRKNVARWWNDITSRESWQSLKDGA